MTNKHESVWAETPHLPGAPVEPDGDESALRRERIWLAALVGLYAALYAAFYPPLYTSLDESANYGMAYVLRHGTIYPGHAGYDLAMSPVGPFGPVFRFPIGFPAVLTLFSFVGSWAFFLVNPVLHIFATWLFAKVLRSLKLPVKLVIFYLLYPSFVLYTRTLFSDAFAASLTTIALYFLLRKRGRGALFAGACLGLALTARSTSLVVALVIGLALLLSDWRSRKEVVVWKGQAIRFLAGLLPFLILNGVYNAFTTGSPFRSTYSAGDLSVSNFLKLGPLYALSLLLIFPGMLLAPLLYRGQFWREGFVATTAVFFIASSYYESTYGGNKLETLVSVSRQILPVMPFYLLAYCGILSPLARKPWIQRANGIEIAACLLLVIAGLISYMHQKHLHVLTGLQAEIRQTLPSRCVVYGNKDVFKIHQPTWDNMTYRELTRVGTQQIAKDLQTKPAFVVLYLRSRGFANEDAANASVLNDMRTRLVLTEGPPSQSGLLRFYRVVGLTPQTRESIALPR